MFMVEIDDVLISRTPGSDENRKRKQALVLLQGAIIRRKHGSDLESVSFSRTAEQGHEDRLSDIEKRNLEMEQEIRRLRRQLDSLNGAVKSLKVSFEEAVESKVDEMLENIGFSPITSDVLSEFKNEDVQKCKSIIIKEIKLTNGYTDASEIAKKHGLPLRLVAGCFDYLLSEGKIGQAEA